VRATPGYRGDRLDRVVEAPHTRRREDRGRTSLHGGTILLHTVGCPNTGREFVHASAVLSRSHHTRMFTARPAIITTVVIDTNASIIMSNLARGVSGIVSVGLNAVAFVKDR
jgi:hypothetical protein